MAILNFGGAEGGNGPAWHENGFRHETGSLIGTTPFAGTYSYQIGNTATTDVKCFSPLRTHAIDQFNVAEIYGSFRLKTQLLNSATSTIFEARTTGDVVKFRIDVAQTGVAEFFDSTGSSLGSSTGATFTTLAYRKVEVRVGTGTSAPWEVKLDGISQGSGNANLTTTNNGNWRWTCPALGNHHLYLDDVILDDAAYPPVNARVHIKTAVAAGSSSAWTGTVEDIDELPPSTSDSISTTTLNNVSTFNMQTNAVAGITLGTIHAVKTCAWMNKTGAPAVNCAVRLKSGATNDDTVNVDLNNGTPGSIGKVYETDPNTGAAWTAAALNEVQVGVVHKQSQVRTAVCNWLALHVLFSLPEAPSDGQPTIRRHGQITRGGWLPRGVKGVRHT